MIHRLSALPFGSTLSTFQTLTPVKSHLAFGNTQALQNTQGDTFSKTALNANAAQVQFGRHGHSNKAPGSIVVAASNQLGRNLSEHELRRLDSGWRRGVQSVRIDNVNVILREETAKHGLAAFV